MSRRLDDDWEENPIKKKFRIAYSGWTTVDVEADSPEQAIDKFWDDGMNDLYDAVIDAQPEEITGDNDE